MKRSTPVPLLSLCDGGARDRGLQSCHAANAQVQAQAQAQVQAQAQAQLLHLHLLT